MIKRFFDIFISLLAFLFLWPLFVVTAVLVRLDSPGPVIFKQRRGGLNGKYFEIYKFRTMVEGAEKMGPPITSAHDPRITKAGRVLRGLKMDELPQFWNVLKGDMSVVGPRPEVPEIIERYSDEEKKVLSVKPGILGPSQIRLRDESSLLKDDETVEMVYIKKILPGKLKTDLAYIANPDPFKDVKLLFTGIAAVLFDSIKWHYVFESRRRSFFLLFDIFVSIFSYVVAFLLRFGGHIPGPELRTLIKMLPFIILIRAPLFVYFGLYQTLWQYMGTQELLSIIKAVISGSLLLPVVPFFLQFEIFPRSAMFIDALLLVTALGGSRVVFKLTAEKLRDPRRGKKKNVLIVGAEDAGELLVREFIKRPNLGYRPVGFIDEDPNKQGVRIHGVKVIGGIKHLAQAALVKKADEVVIALPESSGQEVRRIIRECQLINMPCRIVPHTSAVTSPSALPLKLRPVDVSDLLGREIVQADLAGIQDFFKDKRVLITGAGGSIGSELARLIFQNHPKELILIDHSENNLYDIEMDLKEKISETQVFCYLRDMTSAEDMEKIFKKHKPQAIYHAAAFKHVPMMELHYLKAVLNNVGGTKLMADLALKYHAENFVLISTDKAIRPRSIMGATKRLAELYSQSLKGGSTRFLAVRFGNVFNSKGSVVPLFKKQIEEGGPITLTHPDVKRYFMDVSEAVFLILQASILGSNSEIFVLEMGKPVRILDLAKNLIQLAGLPPGSIPIKFIGLRPGEKLEEEIESDSEKAVPTSHKKIKIWKSQEAPPKIGKEIEEMVEAARSGADREEILKRIKALVPEFQPERKD